ncbi:MAG: HAMP domain-containing sensor histidine kinase [Sulfurimonas sp.]|uniref:sensor histidine kinase n=1 Tax=unclassified Sulfurimonas TaxID=2623549 RepID=UPI0008D77D6C|nr:MULTISPECIES: HAMP domain-containing sensor histidine kinase [unclassified Sulfurimonas]OHE11213.1 MAG: two-component sensor histidine kinase [Sulfurimonas sp. RIFOXYC2_FULL_36_7]OHE16030.1 MAG: two-component sensor histidine kinase [Sulfurimonas sp. RIFOXYB2_FULL_37_5]MBS4067640.1 sensor histidine kinase [Sulfurimonas sp.]MDD3854271.1 HAMP domain-containing sensor histidine kinase [Sulfurimonas sp.]OHE03189.1 MAG: two-component sensor histidine kinase [Sulfurimonas sp. RIFOXYB12_FULL_35_9]
MLKIHQIFIIKFLLLFSASLFITSVISYIALKNIIIEHNKNHLKHAIELMSVELESVKDLDNYVALIHKNTSLRITIVSQDGLVIAESSADKNEMDNHSSRFELMQSNTQKYGDITRYSDTVQTDFLYVAKRVSYKDEQIYVRVSMSLAQIMYDFYSLWMNLFFVFIAIVIIATFVSRTMSQKVVYDIAQITNYLDEVSNKNYKAVIKTRYFYEFLQISLSLKNLVKKLSKNEKKKIKNMAKLRLVNKQRNDILSALSHEFKNPVASIIGYAQTIQEDTDMPQSIRDKFLSKISSNGEKISKMIDRLALSVKLENGDLAINKSEFDIKQLCSEVASNLASKYKNREIIVKVDKRIFLSDKTMLELVLINLVDNALKYSNGDVVIESNEKRISIIDSGIGIKEEHLEKITSKFYRVEKNSWDNSMGLGLAMVEHILKVLDSSLEINSEFGKGSVFSFSTKSMLKS